MVICADDRVMVTNSVVYAMKMLEQNVVGEAEQVGLSSDGAVMDRVKVGEGNR